MTKGFTKFDNIIFEALLIADINCTQLKVLLAIIRYTYGYSREECMITASYLAKITGKSLRSISYTLKELCNKNMIEKRKSHNNNIYWYKINPVDKWKGCNGVQVDNEECCTAVLQQIAHNKDNNININNIYNSKKTKHNIPTPKATAFSNFTPSKYKTDYKKLEMDALKKKLNRF